LQQADVVRGGGVDETRWLLAVDGLLQVAMKKSVLHVELMDRPRVSGGDAEDDTYCRRFDNRTEGLIVVDAVLLGEAVDHPASLVTSEGAV
jgi:hypothetical protein